MLTFRPEAHNPPPSNPSVHAAVGLPHPRDAPPGAGGGSSQRGRVHSKGRPPGACREPREELGCEDALGRRCGAGWLRAPAQQPDGQEGGTSAGAASDMVGDPPDSSERRRCPPPAATTAGSLPHAPHPTHSDSRSSAARYTCGPTVYDHAHVGHARAYVGLDIVRRVLLAQGYPVMQVRPHAGRRHADLDQGLGMRVKRRQLETALVYSQCRT